MSWYADLELISPIKNQRKFWRCRIDPTDTNCVRSEWGRIGEAGQKSGQTKAHHCGTPGQALVVMQSKTAEKIKKGYERVPNKKRKLPSIESVKDLVRRVAAKYVDVELSTVLVGSAGADGRAVTIYLKSLRVSRAAEARWVEVFAIPLNKMPGTYRVAVHLSAPKVSPAETPPPVEDFMTRLRRKVGEQYGGA